MRKVDLVELVMLLWFIHYWSFMFLSNWLADKHVLCSHFISAHPAVQ